MCERGTSGLGLTSDWMKTWREVFKQIVQPSNAKPITFRQSRESRSSGLEVDHLTLGGGGNFFLGTCLRIKIIYLVQQAFFRLAERVIFFRQLSCALFMNFGTSMLA